IRNLEAWIAEANDPAADPLREISGGVTDGGYLDGAIASGAAYLYGDPAAKPLLMRWWNESIGPLLPTERKSVLDEVFRYDILTLPVDDSTRTAARSNDLSEVSARGVDYHVLENVELAFDIPRIVAE